MVEFEKLPYSPDLKMVPICLVNWKSSKGYNVQMSLCLTFTRDAKSHNGQRQGYVVVWVCTAPQKIALSSPVKIQFLFYVISGKWHKNQAENVCNNKCFCTKGQTF